MKREHYPIKLNPTFDVTFVLFSEEFYEEYIKQIQNYDNITFSTEKFNIDYEPIISINDSRKFYKNITNNDIIENEIPFSNTMKESIFKRIIKKIINN